MKITLRQLQIFAAVAEHGTTTAAAVSIPLSQSATSAALAELESLLGTQLFDRIGKRLHLNEAGRALLPLARVTLDGAQDIERQFHVSGEHPGTLPVSIRLGASTTVGNYLLPARIARLLAEQPQAQVQMHIGNTQDIVQAVLRLEVDAGVIEGPCHADDLEVLPWGEDPLAIVAAADHPLATQLTRCRIDDLRRQRWLLRESGSGTRESMDNILTPHLGGFETSLQLGSTEAIKQAALAGLGIACLPLCAIRDALALQQLALLDTDLPPLSRTLYRIRHRSKRFTDSLAQLLA